MRRRKSVAIRAVRASETALLTGIIYYCKYGEMQEWFNWPLSKSGEPQGSGSSNLPLSATISDPDKGLFSWRRIGEMRTPGLVARQATEEVGVVQRRKISWLIFLSKRRSELTSDIPILSAKLE